MAGKCDGCGGHEVSIWNVRESDKIDAELIGKYCLNCLNEKQFIQGVPLPPLPKKGEKISVAVLLILAREYGHCDIVEMLENNPPVGDFVSDGASMFPDRVNGCDIYPAAFWHDVRYWAGQLGDDMGRLLADVFLTLDVATITGDTALARTMFAGVGVGGAGNLPTPWRWGFGRD